MQSFTLSKEEATEIYKSIVANGRECPLSKDRMQKLKEIAESEIFDMQIPETGYTIRVSTQAPKNKLLPGKNILLEILHVNGSAYITMDRGTAARLLGNIAKLLDVHIIDMQNPTALPKSKREEIADIMAKTEAMLKK